MPGAGADGADRSSASSASRSARSPANSACRARTSASTDASVAARQPGANPASVTPAASTETTLAARHARRRRGESSGAGSSNRITRRWSDDARGATENAGIGAGRRSTSQLATVVKLRASANGFPPEAAAMASHRYSATSRSSRAAIARSGCTTSARAAASTQGSQSGSRRT